MAGCEWLEFESAHGCFLAACTGEGALCVTGAQGCPLTTMLYMYTAPLHSRGEPASRGCVPRPMRDQHHRRFLPTNKHCARAEQFAVAGVAVLYVYAPRTVRMHREQRMHTP